MSVKFKPGRGSTFASRAFSSFLIRRVLISATSLSTLLPSSIRIFLKFLSLVLASWISYSSFSLISNCFSSVSCIFLIPSTGSSMAIFRFIEFKTPYCLTLWNSSDEILSLISTISLFFSLIVSRIALICFKSLLLSSSFSTCTDCSLLNFSWRIWYSWEIIFIFLSASALRSIFCFSISTVDISLTTTKHFILISFSILRYLACNLALISSLLAYKRLSLSILLWVFVLSC